MIGWIVRGLMLGAGILTGWVIAEDAPLFGVVQIMVTLALLALFVAVVAFWPSNATDRFLRFRRGP